MLVLGLVTLSLSAYWQVHRTLERELTRAMLDSTSKSAETINHWLGTLLIEPETIASTPAALQINQNFNLIDQQNIYRYNVLHDKYSNMFLDIYAADRNGNYHTVQYKNNAFSFFKGNISDRDYFKTLMAGGSARITQPLVSRTTGVATIFVVAPIRNGWGQSQGLVGAGISLEYVKRVAEHLRAGKSGYGFIISKNGTFIAHPDPDWVMRKNITDLPGDSMAAFGRAMLAGGSGTFRYRFEGVDRIAFYEPIPIAGWSVATTLPVRELFAPANEMLRPFAIVTLVITLVIAGMIILAARHLTLPLLELASHAALIGSGQVAMAEVAVRSGDEIGTLAATFNGMVKRLLTTLNTLSLSERQYRTLVDNLDIGIFRSQPEPPYGFAQVNPAMLILFQGDDAQALTDLGLPGLFQHGEQWNDFRERLAAKGSVRTMEVAMGRMDGSTLWCQVTASAHCHPDGRMEWIDGVIEDITERKRLEEQLRHSQKMEAIGTLAGGIAHDFNNLLTAIIGYGTLSLEAAAPGSHQEKYINNIMGASAEASKLTRGLLTISRKAAVSLEPLDLNGTVLRVEKLMARIIGEDIDFRATYTGEAVTVLGDSSQLEQVLMNLVANARDSMPEGGRLSISTALIEIHAGPSFLASDPGKYALVTISDTGHGMDEATRQRIFEPFFTTKEVGKGTGLGLSIAYGIIKQHNGEINVYSEPSHGTTFRIYLKCIDKIPEDNQTKAKPAPAGGNETILLAEDDPRVRDLYLTILRQAGYRVLEADNGQEAIELFKQHQREVDLLLFDLVMPKLNGKEAYEQINQLAPGIKVLFSSGYTREIILNRAIAEGGVHFVSKPAAPVELLEWVRKVLDQD